MKRLFMRMASSGLTLALLAACASDTSFITDYDDAPPGPGACLNFDPSARLVSHVSKGKSSTSFPGHGSTVYGAQPSRMQWSYADAMRVEHFTSAQSFAAMHVRASGPARFALKEASADTDLALRRRSLGNVCKNIRRMDHVLMANWLTRDLSRMVTAEPMPHAMHPLLLRPGTCIERHIQV